jgi:hypothetical protein
MATRRDRLGRDQLCFRVGAVLRAAVERAAAAEGRTISNEARVLISRALEAKREPARS